MTSSSLSVEHSILGLISNTEKSIQKPQCEDVDEVTIANQNTPSTLLEADVVNLSDHDDDTDGIIDKDLCRYSIQLVINGT
jgi:hypothetical protein